MPVSRVPSFSWARGAQCRPQRTAMPPWARNSPTRSLGTPSRLKESGTVNVPGILGLGAGLEFVRRRGVERICQEELQKLRYLHGRLSRLGKVTLYTPPPEERFSAPVLSFNLEDRKRVV